VLDRRLIVDTKDATERGKHVRLDLSIRNSDRSTGAMLSGVIARRYGHAGLRDEAIHIKFKGTAGQSFGAFLAKGVTLELEGEANDYVGKGLSGGRIVVYPPQEARKLTPETSIIVGNTVLYGAIAGECYFRGVAGERFGVRNSGAIAVVEGTGDHGCEYMTGGVVVVIGETGRNFAAGMSGGIAYVLDEAGTFAQRCNLSMVDLEAVAAEEEVMQRYLHSGGDLEHHGKVDVMRDMSRFDAERLHQLIVNHARYTGSTRARSILEDWDAYLPKFRKVMPVEYRRALAELAAQSGPRMLAAGE
jgi:glutamate synthase (NADPH/NADH) large chain